MKSSESIVIFVVDKDLWIPKEPFDVITGLYGLNKLVMNVS